MPSKQFEHLDGIASTLVHQCQSYPVDQRIIFVFDDQTLRGIWEALSDEIEAN